MRTVGVVTTARSDYGIYLPLLRKIEADPELQLYLMASGMHLSPEYGLTVEAIEADGFKIGEAVEMLLSSDTPAGIAKSAGLGIVSFAQAFGRFRPDILVVLGDRTEMFAAALAAVPFKIPLAHVHGGEVTLGAIDDSLRHAMSKLSHLHFVSTEAYGRRVVQMGEQPWRVTVCGSPSLDNLRSIRLLGAEELAAQLGLNLDAPPLLVTYHPVTLEYEQTGWQVDELLAALEATGLPAVFTMPNADTGSHIIMRKLQEFVEKHLQMQKIDNLGTQAYFSVMALAPAMVGNSSSGLIEAPSFELPVVNIGTRQAGRIRGANVIDVGYSKDEVVRAIETATGPEFRESLQGIVNPYGTGQASEKIVERLKEIALDDRLLVKHFYDVEVELPIGSASE